MEEKKPKKLNQFANLELLHESKDTLVYRATSPDSTSVVLKGLKKEYPGLKDIQRIRREFEILKLLTHENIIQILDLRKIGNNYFLIMEDIQGESIDKILNKIKKFPLEEFLEIATKVVEALQFIHSKEIIHKDIKPHNIVYNPETKKVKIIDFNNASVLQREEPNIKIRLFEGTIDYVSPEQTGRMNRSLDYRTDFYSLGISFFQMLTGKVPFRGKNPLEVVHNHIARVPLALHTIENIPKFISDIVAKLLEKNPEDRYQSSFGLLYDLEMAKSFLQTGKWNQDSKIASRDISLKFQIPNRLYGREEEIRKLEGYLDKFIKDIDFGNILFIKGEEGSGKNRLFQELTHFLIKNNLYFISLNSKVLGQKQSFYFIDMIVSEIIEYSFSSDNGLAEKWKFEAEKKYTNKLPPFAKNLSSFQFTMKNFPVGNEAYLGNMKEVFFDFFLFIRKFNIRPVIQIENFWEIDLESLEIIDRILSDSKCNHILFVLCCTENVSEKEEPFRSFFSKLRSENFPLPEINVGPMDLDSVCRLLSDTFHCSIEPILELAEIVLQKTKGNLFYTHEFLNLIYKKGLIEKPLNLQSSWKWNTRAIREEVVTDNVIEFLFQLTLGYSGETAKVFQTIACIGPTANLSMLSSFLKKTEWETLEILKEPILSELLFVKDNEIQFTYKKIQDLVLESIELEERNIIYYNLGKFFLLENKQQLRPMEQEWVILGNLNFFIPSIHSQKELLKIFQLNLEFIQNAKSQDMDSKKVYSYCLQILEHESFDIQILDKEIVFQIVKEYATLCAKNRNCQNLEFILTRYIRFFTGEEEKLFELNLLLNYEYIGANKIQECLRNIFQILSDKFSGIYQKETFRNFLSEIIEDSQNPNFLDKAKETSFVNTDPCFRLLIQGCIASYAYSSSEFSNFMVSLYRRLKSSNDKTALEICRILQYIIGRMNQLTNIPEYDLHILENLDKDAWAFFHFLYSTYVLSLQDHIIESFEQYSTILSSQGEQLQPAINAISNLFSFFIQYLSRESLGNLLESEYISGFKDITERSDRNLIMQKWKLVLGLLVGKPEEQTSEMLNSRAFPFLEKWEKNGNNQFLFYYHLADIILWFFQGLYLEVYQQSVKIEKYIDIYIYPPFQLEFYFFYTMSTSFLFNSANDEYGQIYKANARRLTEKVENQFQEYRENSSAKIFLLKAELYRIYGDNFKAIEYYNRSLETAKKFEFRLEEAIADELAGKFWFEQKQNKYGELHILQAMQKYSHHSCVIKLEYLKNQYPKLYGKNLEKSGTMYSTRSSAFYNSSLSSGNFLKTIDSSSFFKSMNLAQDTKNINEFIRKMNSIFIENAGANRGVVVLKDVQSRSLCIYSDLSLNMPFQEEKITVRPIHSYKKIVKSVVHYTERTGNSMLVKDATLDARFSTDEYVQSNRIKSILSLPIIIENEFWGLIYLENNLTGGVFTEDRIEALNLLISKISYPIKNILQAKSVSVSEKKELESMNLLSPTEKEVLEGGGYIYKNLSAVVIGIYPNEIQKGGTGTPGQNLLVLTEFLNLIEQFLGNSLFLIEKLDNYSFILYFDVSISEAVFKSQRILEIFSYKFSKHLTSIGVYEGNSLYTLVKDSRLTKDILLHESRDAAVFLQKLASFFKAKIFIFDENFLEKNGLLKFPLRRIGKYTIDKKNGYICEIFQEKEFSENYLEIFSEAIQAFWNKDFLSAMQLFGNLNAMGKDDPTLEVFRGLSEKYKEGSSIFIPNTFSLKDIIYLEEL